MPTDSACDVGGINRKWDKFPLFPFKISFLSFTQPGNQHHITPLRNVQAHSSKADSDQYAFPP